MYQRDLHRQVGIRGFNTRTSSNDALNPIAKAVQEFSTFSNSRWAGEFNDEAECETGSVREEESNA